MTTDQVQENGNPFGDPEPHDASVDSATRTLPGASLACGRDVTLTLGTDSLIVLDEQFEGVATCCGLLRTKKGPTRSIPYFNILWAENVGTSIAIRYAKPQAKQIVRVAVIEYPLEKPDGADIAPWIESLLERAYGEAQRKKRIKVLINPFGGRGTAQKQYNIDVEPIFAAARCEVDVQTTQHSGNGVDIGEELDIDAFDVVACCSGDGVPHEVFNGFGRRKDALKAFRKVAVAQLPCGSGNAMSINLYGTMSCSLATLCTVKGLRRPLDLASVTQGDQRLLSFLSQTVGIVAESDLGTEHWRWMGDIRFTLGFLTRLFGKTVYPCDIAVGLVEEGKSNIRATYNTAVKSGPFAQPPTAEGDIEARPSLRFGTISDPLPEGWEMVPHDTIGNFYTGNMAYMADDTNFFPAALPSDGCLDMICIDGLVPRRTALKIMMAVADGTLFDMESVEYTKVNGYRIIPKAKKEGFIAIDGEKVPFAPFQVEIHRGLATVLMKSDIYQAKGP